MTQSVEPTGGKIDTAVGPGVGFCEITVQPESGDNAPWVGTDKTTVGAGREGEVAVGRGVACDWGRQPANTNAASNNNNNMDFRIRFSR